jgi:hypothetical protein
MVGEISLLSARGAKIRSISKRVRFTIASMDEPEFLVNGEWLPLSRVPRAWLEREFVKLSEGSIRAHRKLREMRRMLEPGLSGKPQRKTPVLEMLTRRVQ